jgi:peptide/nickel transport system ATP-binding protein
MSSATLHTLHAGAGPVRADQPILKVKDLRVSFQMGDVWSEVVKGISFDLDRNQTLAIVGESGSGKSVTSLAIMRLLALNSRLQGSIRLNGNEMLTLPEERLRRIRGSEVSMIFQEPMTSLNPVMTIGEQIAETLRAHKGQSQTDAWREAVQLLDQVRIPDAAARARYFPHECSGGMRQRAMIAMAIACKPSLLIADEPTTALDVTVQAQILDLIRDLQKAQGMAVLFITHDLGVVAELADRVLVMNRGDTVEDGSTEQIFSAPRAPYTRALLAAIPRLGSLRNEPLPRPFDVVDRKTGEIVPSGIKGTPASAGTPVLEVRGLTTRFAIRGGLLNRVRAHVNAVEKVSFSIAPGETLALVGESGCGKSTVARTIMQLYEPRAGEIRLDGHSITGLGAAKRKEVRRNIQMIFQDPFASLNPRLRVGKAIAEPLLIHGLATATEAERIVAEQLERVGLDPSVTNRFPHEFSGGQRQRICIARALTLEPRLIIADEAVSALDVTVKAQVVNLMLDLQRRLNLSYLFISHDMAVVERLSHRVAVMYLGEIVEIGPRQAVLENPQHPYTKRLLGSVPQPDPSLRGKRAPVAIEELRSPIRPLDFVPPLRNYVTVTDGHLVMQA